MTSVMVEIGSNLAYLPLQVLYGYFQEATISKSILDNIFQSES